MTRTSWEEFGTLDWMQVQRKRRSWLSFAFSFHLVIKTVYAAFFLLDVLWERPELLDVDLPEVPDLLEVPEDLPLIE